MKKSDLEYGNVVELRNGDFYVLANVYNEYILISITGKYHLVLDGYNENLIHPSVYEFDIMKVYKDYTCTELLWERKEKPQLTEDEKVILRNLPKEYKWIARDKSTCIHLFTLKPNKVTWWWNGAECIKLVFPHLFQFIQWEDDEPYSIEDLLKGEEK